MLFELHMPRLTEMWGRKLKVELGSKMGWDLARGNIVANAARINKRYVLLSIQYCTIRNYLPWTVANSNY